MGPDMATEPALALQQAIQSRLAADSGVTGLLGGARIHDDVPPGAVLPYVTYGEAVAGDWGTASEDGREHRVTLHAWSRHGGRLEACRIIAAIDVALTDAPLVLADHHLVNLHYEFSETRRDPDGETFHGLVRYRAVTEPAA